jgi:ribose 5-phosphate isomerase A
MSTADQPDPQRAQKEAAGRHAASYVQDGMRVGLGTGSTVHWTIVALGERKLDVVCTATSKRTEELARSVGLRVVPPDELGRLDVGVDGADEIDPELNLTKGGGGALTREKIVARMCDRWIVVADEHKLVPKLGDFGTPLEILPFAPRVVASWLEALGATSVSVRPGSSDNGNLLVDARFGLIDDPRSLAAELSAVPGVVEHGIFLRELVERVVVAGGGGIRELVNER